MTGMTGMTDDRNVHKRVVRIFKHPGKKLKFVKTEGISTDVTKGDDSSAHDEILSVQILQMKISLTPISKLLSQNS